ncbi:MAG: hypothetical protein KUG77_26250, partial [Nannocystaceae bacterium]|nr:hypothetical protein [Nannocystaceae bacterium]
MDGGTRHAAWAATLMLVGCFSSPPGAAQGGEDTGTSSSSESAIGPTTGDPVTGPTGSAGTTTGPVSSGDTGSSGDSGSGGSETTSGGSTSAETTEGMVECTLGQVELEGQCLSPLNVSEAFSVVGEPAAFAEGGPCIAASCEGALPLGCLLYTSDAADE